MPRNRKPFPAEGYEVGYGRPPRHSRFKPGQSGNPKGRPKGRKNLATIIEDALYRLVAVTENGRKRKLPAIQAMVLSLTIKALEGDARAVDKLIKLLPMIPAASAAANGAAEESPAFDPQHDAALLAEFAEMIHEAEDTPARKPRRSKKEKKT